MLILQIAYDPASRVLSTDGDYIGTVIDNGSAQITVSGIPEGYIARIDFRVSVTDDLGETVYPHLMLDDGSCILPVSILKACRRDRKLPLQLVLMKDREVIASKNILIVDVSPAIDVMGIIDDTYSTVSNAFTDVSEEDGVMTFTRLNGTTEYVNIDDDIADGLASKVDKVEGKELSANDLTDILLVKINGIQDGAQVNINADWSATEGDAEILNKPSIPNPQIQADWEKADPDDVDFIKNKPSIPDPQIQTDWAKTDSGDVDFIKNKPFVPVPSDTVPASDLPDGRAGSGTEYSREDHVHPSDASKADKSALGSASVLDAGTSEGDVPVLVSGGKLPDSVIPSLAISELAGTVTTRSLLATLTSAQRGDYAVVTSDPEVFNNGTFLLNGPASEPTAWIQISSPGGGGAGVSSVNGHTGVVTLGASDIGAVPTTRRINSKPLSADVMLSPTDIGLDNVESTASAIERTVTKAQYDHLKDGADAQAVLNDLLLSTLVAEQQNGQIAIAGKNTKGEPKTSVVLKDAGSASDRDALGVVSGAVLDGLRSYTVSGAVDTWDAATDADQIANGYTFEKKILLDNIPHPESLYPIVSVSPKHAKTLSPQCITNDSGIILYSNADVPVTIDRILLIPSTTPQ